MRWIPTDAGRTFRRPRKESVVPEAATLPYVTAYGNITKVLNKIKDAETPPRFAQDYLATTLQMPGGSAKPLIPFLKRAGMLGSDGVPTDRYKRFRNSGSRGAAAAEALRTAYAPMYAVNEYIHDEKNDEKILGIIMQVTGAAQGTPAVKATLGSFKALRAFADFSAAASQGGAGEDAADGDGGGGDRSGGGDGGVDGLKLSYNINLHLPPTSDVAVFNAIFKSLKEHLL
jgi:hypothetical protein